MESSDHKPTFALPGSLAALAGILACVAACPDAVFTFDVLSGGYVADIPARLFGALAVTGPMTLAIYNDLKVSQLIHEHDDVNQPSHRRFTLTDHGRRLAETWGS